MRTSKSLAPRIVFMVVLLTMTFYVGFSQGSSKIQVVNKVRIDEPGNVTVIEEADPQMEPGTEGLIQLHGGSDGIVPVEGTQIPGSSIKDTAILAPASLTPGFIKSYGESSPGSGKLEGAKAPDHYSENDLLSPMQVEPGAELRFDRYYNILVRGELHAVGSTGTLQFYLEQNIALGVNID